MGDWSAKTCRDNERFTIPKASLTFSQLGSPVYGLRDRTAVRALAHQFERDKAQKNQESYLRQSRPPSGKRYEARQHYFTAIQDRQHEDSKNSCTRVSDKHCKIYGTSRDNPLKETGSQDEQQQYFNVEQDQATQMDENNTQISNQHLSSTSLNMTTGGTGKISGNSRYLARDYQRIKQIEQQFQDSQQLRKNTYISEDSQACQSFRAAKLKESQLIKSYPHGLPKILLKEMRDLGLELPCLGYGLSSMLPESAQMFLRI
eukprot:TRINITY_DN11433_c0_g2_i2.p1 TRINITY_DN11433_c0_g2~~TRINITY_DN11433_c0_g2_i2.p1  ORF type:complete len:260 (-),score=23.73 TRINITY_DN11433_c0_g2_i2:661-1440(-)